ncbi:ABC transporter permease [Schaalia naturae]|uniref:ABC transporter permease n=1 Tax=Schaalia naturae TaxID=635203 RepID=A0ABW2SPW0_9ACTO
MSAQGQAAATSARTLPEAPAPGQGRSSRAGGPSRTWNLVLGAVLFGMVLLTALVSLVWTPHAIDDTSGPRLEGPTAAYLLGTDRLGHDLLAQLMVGARLAVVVGLGAVAIGALIGVSWGLWAAISRRWADSTLTSAIDVMIAFPTILLAMLLVSVMGASLRVSVVAVGIAMSAPIARITRASAGQVLHQDFVEAAQTSGARRPRIIRRHILPNIAPTLVVQLALQWGAAVLAEASLSYLGLGSPPPNASWGRMLQEAQATVLVAPLGAIAPGVMLVIAVLGVNLLADGLRDVLDPELRRVS